MLWEFWKVPSPGQREAQSKVKQRKGSTSGTEWGRQGGWLACLPDFLACPLGQQVVAGRLLSHFTQATVSKGTMQTLGLHQSEVTTQFPERGRRGGSKAKRLVVGGQCCPVWGAT